MPPVLTANAPITCVHGGRVTVRPGQQAVTIDGGAVLCEPDLVGSPVTGCTVPATAMSKPCTLVVATLPGSSNPKVTVGGRPVLLATLQGLTDGVPPSPLVVQPAQTRVHA